MGKSLFKIAVLIAVLCFATAYAAKADTTLGPIAYTGNGGDCLTSGGSGNLDINSSGGLEFLSTAGVCYAGGTTFNTLSTLVSGSASDLYSLNAGTYVESGAMCNQSASCTLSNFTVTIASSTMTISDLPENGSIAIQLNTGGSTNTPEPSTLGMFSLGLLGLTGAGVVRKQTV